MKQIKIHKATWLDILNRKEDKKNEQAKQQKREALLC
jgi:hypothetical protein